MGKTTLKKDLLTIAHEAECSDNYQRAVVPPVYLTSLHTFKTFEDYLKYDCQSKEEFLYGRTSNPTTTILEQKLAQLENGKNAVAFASGMGAATAAIMALCKTNGHIICMKDTYVPVKSFLDQICLKRLNISVTYISGLDLQELEDAICDQTQLIILESPATFVFTVVDLKKIANIAKKHGVKTYIDNTYSTPIFQKPLDYGIDVVMHTLSKYIGGHSDLIGGVLISNDEEILRVVRTEIREWFGGVLGPMEAWLAIRGLRTLKVRIMQHQECARVVSDYLEQHPMVEKVYYPGHKSHPQYELAKKQQKGNTGLMSFLLDGTLEETKMFLNKLNVFSIGCSWGGFESLALCPLYTKSKEELDFLGLEEKHRGLIRIHCGLEEEENLIEDLENAFDYLKEKRGK